MCIVRLARPELSLDARDMNARLTRLEDLIKSGKIVAPAPGEPARSPAEPRKEPEEEERPPLPDDGDAPPLPEEEPRQTVPDSFWVELLGDVRSQLKPPASGFFVATPGSPLRGVLKGDRLEIRCANAFAAEIIGTPEILRIVSDKATARLGRPVTALVVDVTKNAGSPKMEQLMNFGRAHSDIVKIRNQ